MTEDELAVLETRARAATPGPWLDSSEWCTGPFPITAASDALMDDGGEERPGGFIRSADADFVIDARMAVPALVAEVRRLRAELASCSQDGHTDDAPEGMAAMMPLLDMTAAYPKATGEHRLRLLTAIVRWLEDPSHADAIRVWCQGHDAQPSIDRYKSLLAEAEGDTPTTTLGAPMWVVQPKT